MLSAADTYSGPTAITAGALQLGNSDAVQSSTVTVDAAGGLAFSAGIGTFYLGGLAGTSSFALVDAGSNAVVLNTGGNNQSTTYAGVLSGSGSLVLSGTGTLVLGGLNTYSGGTTIAAGTLELGGTAANGGVQGNILDNGTLGFANPTALGYARRDQRPRRGHEGGQRQPDPLRQQRL